jgi:hypothetical protein
MNVYLSSFSKAKIILIIEQFKSSKLWTSQKKFRKKVTKQLFL